MKIRIVNIIVFLVTMIILFVGYLFLYPNSSYNQFVRQDKILSDFWIEYNEIPNDKLISELIDIAENSKYPDNKLRATTALTTIYAEGMRGKLKDFHKAYYWCNKISLINYETYKLSECNRFIESD